MTAASLIHSVEVHWSQHDALMDCIVQSIDAFTKNLAFDVEHDGPTAHLGSEKNIIALRGILDSYWKSMKSCDEKMLQSLTYTVCSLFESLGFPKVWFNQAQMHLLNAISDYYDNLFVHHSGAVDYISLASEQKKALNSSIMLSVYCFYSLNSEHQNEKFAKDKKHFIAALQSKIMNMVTGMAQSGAELKKTTNRVLDSTRTTQVQVVSMVSMSSQFSQNVEFVSNSTQNLLASVDAIANQLSHGAAMTRKSTADARKAQEVVQSLSTAAQKIGEVVKIINEIANQTNLLALNATIEAARAGSAGKGFSVVASEVKSLAGQTAKATDEITMQIKAMQEATNKVVTSINEMTCTIADVNEGTAIIASAVSDQGSAAQEIFRSIEQVAASSTNFMSVINQMKSLTTDTGEFTQETLNLSVKVADQSEYLKEVLGQLINFVIEQDAQGKQQDNI